MLKRLFVPLLLFVCGLLAGLVLTGRLRYAEETIAETVATVASQQTAPPTITANVPNFTGIAAARIESVVNISSQILEPRQISPFGGDPFFQYFFGDEPDLFGWDRQESLGSGVIVSQNGYILTNNHVVGNPDAEVTVTLVDKREYVAEVIGVDQWTDLALLKINEETLQPAPWGNSSGLKVAEWVLAIGNPFQLNQTVTLGIVSAVGRANLGIATYEDFIQTDAAINQGNSGGALINGRGELVGINTAIYSQSGGDQGVGFAVPSNLARRVMKDFIEFGEVRRGSIGYIEIAPLTNRLAAQLGVPDGRGALIQRMRRDSAAYDAGLRPGDVVTIFEDTSVEDASHLLRLLADANIGKTVTLGVIRDGDSFEIEVQIALGQQGGR
jgi:Do/DeqQ family serine protease